jgi:hypothetical protein
MINLNDTTPAAPTGGFNVKWQQDSSGNVSAYTGPAALGAPPVYAPVAGVLTINAAASNVAYINVNAAITSIVVNNPTDGQIMTIFWIQDGTGHAIALPAFFIGATAPSTTANKHSIQQFLYHAADTNWYGVAAGQTGL